MGPIHFEFLCTICQELQRGRESDRHTNTYIVTSLLNIVQKCCSIDHGDIFSGRDVMTFGWNISCAGTPFGRTFSDDTVCTDLKMQALTEIVDIQPENVEATSAVVFPSYGLAILPRRLTKSHLLRASQTRLPGFSTFQYRSRAWMGDSWAWACTASCTGGGKGLLGRYSQGLWRCHFWGKTSWDSCAVVGLFIQAELAELLGSFLRQNRLLHCRRY